MLDVHMIKSAALLVARPTGVLRAHEARLIVEFVEIKETLEETGFNRFCDLTGLTGIYLSSGRTVGAAGRRSLLEPGTIFESSRPFWQPIRLPSESRACMNNFCTPLALKYGCGKKFRLPATGSESIRTRWSFDCGVKSLLNLCQPSPDLVPILTVKLGLREVFRQMSDCTVTLPVLGQNLRGK